MNHQINVNYTSPSGTVVAQASATGNVNLELDLVVPASSTNYLVDTVDFPITGLQAVLFYSAVDMTVKTNSSSAPDQTITLVAGVPFFWTYGNGTDPITAAISKIYVTSTAGGTLNVRALWNA